MARKSGKIRFIFRTRPPKKKIQKQLSLIRFYYTGKTVIRQLLIRQILTRANFPFLRGRAMLAREVRRIFLFRRANTVRPYELRNPRKSAGFGHCGGVGATCETYGRQKRRDFSFSTFAFCLRLPSALATPSVFFRQNAKKAPLSVRFDTQKQRVERKRR